MRLLRDRTLALAGVLRGCVLAHQIASTGQIEADQLRACIDSVLDLDAPDVDAVYGSIEALHGGLHQLISMRRSATPRVGRYAIAILGLERALYKNIDAREKLAAGIAKAREQAQYFDDSSHESVIAALATHYKTLISPLGPRIMITGEPVYLENPRHADEVRALLLTSLRSAVLWRQLGGRRLHLIFGYRSMIDEAKRLLEHRTGHRT